MTKLLEKFGWETLDHPLYDSDLAPSDFHLFTKMKVFLGGKHVATDEEVKETVTDWLNESVADCFDEGIVKLVQCLATKINICCV
jgi:hypothetical protein